MLFADRKGKSCAKEVYLHSQVELTAATLSVKVASFLKKELDLDEIEERLWTGSKVVLGYITNDVRRFKTFFANRVKQIKDNTTSGQWCYIPTKEILQIVPQGD